MLSLRNKHQVELGIHELADAPVSFRYPYQAAADFGIVCALSAYYEDQKYSAFCLSPADILTP